VVVVAALETLQGLLGSIINHLHNIIIMVNIVAVIILPRNDGMSAFHSTKVVAMVSQVGALGL